MSLSNSGKDLTLVRNNWHMVVEKKTDNGKPIYDVQINLLYRKRKKVGSIANEFLALGCFIDRDIVIFQDRLSKWQSWYGNPPISVPAWETIEQEDNMVYVYGHETQIVKSTVKKTIDKPKYPLHLDIPNTEDAQLFRSEYNNAIKHRFDDAVGTGFKSHHAHYELSFTHSWHNGQHIESIILYNDIWPLILYDICETTKKYNLKKCAGCGAYYFPINGITHCMYCKPASKRQCADPDNAESKPLSHNLERSAFIKKLQRLSLDHEQINEELRKKGMIPVRKKMPIS